MLARWEVPASYPLYCHGLNSAASGFSELSCFVKASVKTPGTVWFGSGSECISIMGLSKGLIAGSAARLVTQNHIDCRDAGDKKDAGKTW